MAGTEIEKHPKKGSEGDSSRVSDPGREKGKFRALEMHGRTGGPTKGGENGGRSPVDPAG